MILLLLGRQHSYSQDSFVNLDFESTTLAPDGSPSTVATTVGLPGWTAVIGGVSQSTILYNDVTLGNASIAILGSGNSLSPVIEGQFTVVLQPGRDPLHPVSPNHVSASISQVGLVPANAQSIQFKASTFSSFSVSLDGQNLSMIPLGTGQNFTLYGADISAFAGQFRTLAITALAAPNTTDAFDSIVFSPQPIPEPSVVGLFAFGALLLGQRLHKRQ